MFFCVVSFAGDSFILYTGTITHQPRFNDELDFRFICCHFSGKRSEPSRASFKKSPVFMLSFVLYYRFRLLTLLFERIEIAPNAKGISGEKSTKHFRTNQSVLFETRQFHSFICMKKFSSFVECELENLEPLPVQIGQYFGFLKTHN